jgi:hypothetical protein
MSLNRNGRAFVLAAEEKFGIGAIITRDNINSVVEEKGVPYPHWLVTKSEHRYDRGLYRLPNIGTQQIKQKEPELEMNLSAQVVSFRQPKLIDDSDTSIPTLYPV